MKFKSLCISWFRHVEGFSLHYFVNLWRNEKVKLYKVRRCTAEAFVYSFRFRRPHPNRLMCTLCAKSCVRCTVSYLQWLMCT